MKSGIYIGLSIVVATSLILSGCQKSAVLTKEVAANNASAQTAAVELPEAFKGDWVFKDESFFTLTITDSKMLSGDKDVLYTTETFEIIDYHQASNKVDLKIKSIDEGSEKTKSVDIKASLTLKDDELIIHYDPTDVNEETESIWIRKK